MVNTGNVFEIAATLWAGTYLRMPPSMLNRQIACLTEGAHAQVLKVVTRVIWFGLGHTN
jgi:hypothetical protein